MKKHYRGFSTKHCKILLFAFIFVLSVVEISSKPQIIDCRKHVYAPICRGIAAKRDGLASYSDGLRLLAKKLSWDFASQQYSEI